MDEMTNAELLDAFIEWLHDEGKALDVTILDVGECYVTVEGVGSYIAVELEV